MDTFSQRHGLSRPDAEITIRYEAPETLRYAIVQISYDCNLKPSDLRAYLCQILFKFPDQNNWSEYPNIDGEVQDLISDCEWFEIYDLIERIAIFSSRRGNEFTEKINNYFRIAGVGWQLNGDQIQFRGTEVFELAVRQGQEELQKNKKHTAANELHEAIQDLSRRPNPEISGSIQHSMAALECLARDLVGSKETLGNLIQKNPNLFPKPLDQIVEKAWGYTSNYGRHLTEGGNPTFEEAELVVGISGVLCRYLSRKITPH